jgi:hypothetical protein
MARVYADLIMKGLKTIEDVPIQLREAVLALIDGGNEP